MGKGGKRNQKVQKSKEREQKVEPPKKQPEADEGDQDIEEFSDSEDNFLQEEEDEDEQLLKKIQDQIIGSDENVKLTWAAIHSLKLQENKINEQMDEQMRKIKAKYDLLKQPIFQQIAKAASGDIVEKQLYNKHELTKSLNLKKFKPKKIQNFWMSVFDSVGLLGSDEDKMMFSHCSKVECKTIQDQQADEETIILTLQFEENQFFSNKQLKLTVHRKQTQVDAPEVSRLQQKKPLQQELILKQIFNPQADAYKLYEYAGDIQRAYNQAIFFYFFESRLDNQVDDSNIQAEQQNQLDDGDQDQDEEEDDNDDDQDDQDVGKPVKRRKLDKNNGEKIEKPQCKNQ